MQGPRGAKGVVPMKIISWNCRGLARSKAIRALRAMLIEQKPDIVFLCEIKTSSLAKISQCFHSAQLISSEFVPPVGKAGGICLAWFVSVSVQVILKHNWFINALVFPNPLLPMALYWCSLSFNSLS
ncbi:UNVERIFIED_CONTAM: hypothetical protein Sangu_2776700 [Sesamum angustifolium]|uniref:Endonuclease/exonuclease/phosphatase domain-containing protein n=1 Tax=Sesamum angustifolium TaxID=2727405 RepID=A0AAW2ITP6_9LAMI